ncbi:MAG: hypothetical protein U0X39_11130 [Bacteroidales bacterium]
MNKLLLSCIILLSSFTLVGCMDKAEKEQKAEASLKKEAVKIATEYSMGQLSDGKITSGERGTVIVSNDEKRYIIDPVKIFPGIIDDKPGKDIIVTLMSFKGLDIDNVEQLIMVSASGKLMLLSSVESDMRVLAIEKGVITAQVPTHPRNTPLYNCAACQEIINFRFVNGRLEKVEK